MNQQDYSNIIEIVESLSLDEAINEMTNYIMEHTNDYMADSVKITAIDITNGRKLETMMIAKMLKADTLSDNNDEWAGGYNGPKDFKIATTTPGDFMGFPAFGNPGIGKTAIMKDECTCGAKYTSNPNYHMPNVCDLAEK